MAVTYEPIATNTLGSDTVTISFTSISGSYTDLVLVTNHYMTAQCTVGIRFNSDTGSNYSFTVLTGNGTSAASSRASTQTSIDTDTGVVRNPSVSNAMTIWNIQNYSNSTTYKSVVIRHTNATTDASGTSAGVGTWRNTAAITSITLLATSSVQSFKSGSTFTLYGIKAA
jgi:hypothetical protein